MKLLKFLNPGNGQRTGSLSGVCEKAQKWIIFIRYCCINIHSFLSVSYTHLTLPTKLEV